MKTIEELKSTPRVSIQAVSIDGGCGIVQMPKWMGSVVFSFGGGWDHVSVCPYKRNIMPSWEDMCRLKDMFFREDEWVVEFHPAKSEYVNNMPNCLHLWKPQEEKMPTPPSWMVGAKDGQSMEEAMKEAREAMK